MGGKHTLLILALSCAAGVAFAAPLPVSRPHAAPASATTMDISQRVDINELSMSLTNFGAYAYDLSGLLGGLEFPRGSGKTGMFAGGLWLGAMVGGQPRVTVAEYDQEYRPGSARFGTPESPSLDANRVYRLNRVYGDPVGRDNALTEYENGALSRGAPLVSVLPDGSLDIPGDVMFWSVCNDFLASAHVNEAGSTSPLGMEVKQTTWAYDRPGPFGRSLFMRFTIINRGTLTLADMHVGFWADPDLGDFVDDLVGCDSLRGLGYCYNGSPADAIYGSAPPAVGMDLLQGPYRADLGARLGLTAFAAYKNGTDPLSASESFQSMHGRDLLGNPILDPNANPTRFKFAGDPVAGTGWIDTAPADKRMLLSTGPITMAPGDIQELVVVLFVAQGTDRLDSVSQLEADDQLIQTAFDTNTLGRLEVPGSSGAQLALQCTWPTPSRGGLSVAFSLPATGETSLDLLDVSGRRVAGRNLGRLAPGPHVESLARETDSLPAGMYFLRLTLAGASVVGRLVLTR